MQAASFPSIAAKTTIVHTVTYFLVGLLTFTLFDYRTNYADPLVANVFRQTSDPLVAGGPAVQVVRGLLFGIAFYALRDAIFTRPRGWLTLWLLLVVMGIFSTFGAAPGSVEGFLYSLLPVWFQLMSLPELLIQSFLLAWLTHHWVNHPEQKWLGWVLGVAFVVVVFLSAMGVLVAVGVLPRPT